YEALPGGQVAVPLQVHPGDSVSVSLMETSPNLWHLTFTNNSTGKGYQTNISYTSSHASADWIEEMPLGQFAHTAGYVPLDQFGSISFTNASAITSEGTQNLTALNAQPLTMINGAHETLAQPSAIGNDSESFTVSRTNATTQASLPVIQGRTWRRSGQTEVRVQYYRSQGTIIQQVIIPTITRNGNMIMVRFSF